MTHPCPVHVSCEMAHTTIIVNRTGRGGHTVKIRREQYRCPVEGCHCCDGTTEYLDKSRGMEWLGQWY